MPKNYGYSPNGGTARHGTEKSLVEGPEVVGAATQEETASHDLPDNSGVHITQATESDVPESAERITSAKPSTRKPSKKQLSRAEQRRQIEERTHAAIGALVSFALDGSAIPLEIRNTMQNDLTFARRVITAATVLISSNALSPEDTQSASERLNGLVPPKPSSNRTQ